MDVLFTFEIEIDSQNLAYGCTKDQWPYPNQYQDAKPQSGTHIQIKIKSQTSVRNIQCPLKAHIMTYKIWLFLCLQNQDRVPKLRIWFYLRPVTISRSRSRSKTAARNLPNPPNPQSPKIGLKGHGYSFHPQTKMVTISKSWSRCKTPIWDKLNA